MSPDAVNQRLVDQYTEIARLAGGLAHEIKNPLSTIRLNMELLAEDFRESDGPRDRRAMRKIELVERECQRLQDLLDGFLDFAKVRRLKLEPSDLSVQVRQVSGLLPSQGRGRADRDRRLSLQRPGHRAPGPRELSRGLAQPGAQLPQQAMPDGGQLVVRTYNAGQGVALDLIDTGCGMDAETQAHAFDAFYSTKRSGSGLGLPTARKIVEAHGGHIAVQSEPGRGTRFTVLLPVPPPPAGRRREDGVLARGGEGVNMLSIRRIDSRRDDIRAAMAELRKRLSPEGNVVSEAGRRRTIEVFGEAAHAGRGRPADLPRCEDAWPAGSAGLLGPHRSRGADGRNDPRAGRRTCRGPRPGRQADSWPPFAASANESPTSRKPSCTKTFASKCRAAIWIERYRPLDRVGICVPGGAAAYPSTVLMTAVPAQVAGVKELALVAPPTKFGAYNPDILATCCELGIEEVYRIGGAQAVAGAGLRSGRPAAGRQDRRAGQSLRRPGQEARLRRR